MRRFTLFKYLSLCVFFALCLAVYRNIEGPEPGKTMREDYLPSEWKLTSEMKARIFHRRQHVKEVCQKYGLDQPSPSNHRNTFEFLINKEHGLIWCNVFKAASSSWFWNFNLLAGYTEEELLDRAYDPLTLARKKYPRPNAAELLKARSGQPPPLTFMIARHPFHRLVSGYRNKILLGNKGFRSLSLLILRSYPHIISQHPESWVNVLTGEQPMPSFAQFIQYLIDMHASHRPFDVHWRPMNELCSPCLNHFDMIAKVETLQEDANYIIFTTGIQSKIKPKVINQATGSKTEEVADEFLCLLSRKQISDLTNIYKIDLELFEYDTDKYFTCTKK